MKICPKCSLKYNDEVIRCKCGYNFYLANQTDKNEIKKESVKEIEANTTATSITLSAWSVAKGFGKKRQIVEWTVSLNDKNAEFRPKGKGVMAGVINVLRPGSDQMIDFTDEKFDLYWDEVLSGKILADEREHMANLNVIKVKSKTTGTFGFTGTTTTVLGIKAEDQDKLKTWVLPLTVKDVKNEIRGWGIPLILIGAAHLIFRNFLNPVWGVALMVLGVVNLAIPVPAMAIINGLALICVGLLNIFTFSTTIFLAGGSHFWILLGIFQIGWGASEIGKYKRYSRSVEKEKMQVNKDVEGLIRALKDEDWHVRSRAAVALGWIKDARAVEPLTEALKDEYYAVRWKAAWVLKRIKKIKDQ